MKNFLFIAVIGLSALVAFKVAKNEKTIANLKDGIKGETTASAKYAAFAQKASDEGYQAVAKLFKSASKSESIHAANHIKVLESLGVKSDKITPDFGVKTTAENLQSAEDGETYEVSTMYPQFISDAKTEKVDKAQKSFNWAFDTEKKHMVFYNDAINALKAKNEKALPASYAVCPVCGNTYDASKVDAKCSFCQTGKEKFIII